MGYTGVGIGRERLATFMERELTGEMVAHCTADGLDGERVFYAAMKHGDKVEAVIVLYRRENGFITYRAMGEHTGPYYWNGVSRKVLDVLTPTDNGYKLEWREKARGDLERREELAIGAIVQVEAEPCDFVGELTEKRDKEWWIVLAEGERWKVHTNLHRLRKIG